MAAVWIDIDQALRAVIGTQGAAAIYTRSLLLAAREHAWLLDAWSDDDRQLDVTRLKAEMAKRDVAEAAAAGRALLHTFNRLISSLIGEPLTEQILRSVYDEPRGDALDEVRTS